MDRQANSKISERRVEGIQKSKMIELRGHLGTRGFRKVMTGALGGVLALVPNDLPLGMVTMAMGATLETVEEGMLPGMRVGAVDKTVLSDKDSFRLLAPLASTLRIGRGVFTLVVALAATDTIEIGVGPLGHRALATVPTTFTFTNGAEESTRFAQGRVGHQGVLDITTLLTALELTTGSNCGTKWRALLGNTVAHLVGGFPRCHELLSARRFDLCGFAWQGGVDG